MLYDSSLCNGMRSNPVERGTYKIQQSIQAGEARMPALRMSYIKHFSLHASMKKVGVLGKPIESNASSRFQLSNTYSHRRSFCD